MSEVESVFIEELENRSPNIWHNVFQKFYQKLESSEASLIEAIGTDFISSEQSNQYVNKYAFNSFMHLLSRIKNEIEDVKLVDRTVDLFINKLMYNDKGLARPFYIKNDVDTAYMKAKSACESYARLLSKIDISKDEFPKEIYSNKVFPPDIHGDTC